MADNSYVWEERDTLLAYKSIDLNELKKIDLLGVPVDNVTRDEAMAKVLDYLEKKDKVRFVLFVDPLKLMRIRPKKKYAKFLESDLIIAEGKGLQWSAKKLGYNLKERISIISFLMDLFRLAHKCDYTIYLLGSRPENVEKVYTNISRNLPGIRIIGRQSGYFTKEWEEKIKESMRKSSPDIVLVGMGFPKQEKWIRDNLDVFTFRDPKNPDNVKHSLVIGVDNAFDILSGNRNVPEVFQIHGLQWLWRLLSKPYRIDRWFYFFKFYILVYWKSLFKKKSSGSKESSNSI
ncbi:MAG: glycosyl transferase [Leptospiraceae bacterium]|nr:MAG: glycosyl transferase [Leptospiraceae bacterium]